MFHCRSRIEGDLLCGDGDCRFSCDSLNMLLYHKALCHGNRGGEGDGGSSAFFPCNLCDAKVATRHRLWEHVRIHGEAHRCPECYRIFASASRLAEHCAASHGVGGARALRDGKVLSCPDCRYTCRKKRLLVLHRRRTHFAATRCQDCGERFTSFKRFQSHRKLHSSSSSSYARRHICTHDGCEYSAGTASDLRTHLLVHGEKALSCRDCDFRCRRVSELNRHRRNRHDGGSGEGDEQQGRLFKCEACGHRSTTRQHLQRHLASVHGWSAEGRRQQVVLLRCKLCDYRTTSADALRKHVLRTLAHAGADLYACDGRGGDCDFRSNSAVAFRRHLLAVHAVDFATAFDVVKFVEDYFVDYEGANK